MSEPVSPAEPGRDPSAAAGTLGRSAEERREVRRQRRRRRRWKRRLRRWGPVVGALVLLGLVAAFVFLRDAREARRGLNEAQEAVAAVRAALGEADLSAARDHVEIAERSVGRAHSRTAGPIWGLAAEVPVIGADVDATRAVVAVAGAAVQVLDGAVEDASTFVGPDGRIRITRGSDGRIDLASIEEAGRALEDLPLDRLRDARDRLRRTTPSGLVAEVADGRERSLALADDAIGTIERGRDLLSALPPFLGSQGPRRYFLAMQNPSELRGTGGLVGFFAVLTADRGELSITAPEAYNVLDRAAQGSLTPVETFPAFERRYGHDNAAGFFANVNLDPDLPTTAEVMLDLYEARRDRRLDGVVALDPIGLSYLLRGVGPVPLPDMEEDAADVLPDPVPPERIPKLTMIEAYEIFGGANPDRKEFLSLFAQAVFEHLFSTEWDAVAVGKEAALASGERHLQVYSRDDAEQEAFERLGIAGAMRPYTSKGDLLTVTGINAAGNKMDVHVAHRISADISLGAVRGGESVVADREVRTRVSLENPLPTSGRAQYIIGAHPPHAAKDPEALWSDPAGLNRTWFTVWTPETTHFVSGTDAGGGSPVFRSDQIHGLTAIDHVLETRSETTQSFEVVARGPASLERDGEELVYRLTLWRQAKAIPDHWDILVAPPPGWTATDVSFTGGGQGAGMGVGGERVPLRAELDAGRARLTGSATADVHLRVRFRRG